jgi:RecA/RadA recombinase
MASSEAAQSILSAALGYAARGWRVFPCWFPIGTGCACSKGSDCPRAGKHPIGRLVPNGMLDATVDAVVIAAWWRQYPEANIGLRCGVESGFWVLDVDAYKGGTATLEELETRFGKLPNSVRARTGSGGGSAHVLFSHPGEGTRIPSRPLGPGLDIKADGGYVIAAPSRHSSGGIYAWLDEDESRLEAAPAWLLAKVVQRQSEPKAPIETGLELPQELADAFCQAWFARAAKKIEAGESRHDTALWLWVQLKDNAVGLSTAETWVGPFLDLCRDLGQARLVTEEEIRRALEWAYQKPRRDPLPAVARTLAGFKEATEAGDFSPTPSAPTPPPEPKAAPPEVFPWIDLETLRSELRIIAETRRPTRIPSLDKALKGGLPGGVVCSLVGPPGSCKSVFAIQLGLDRATETGGVLYVYSPDQGGNQPLERLGSVYGDIVQDEIAFAQFVAGLGDRVKVADERDKGVTLESFRDAIFARGDAAAVVIDTPQTVLTASDEDGERARIDAAMECGKQIAGRALVPVIVPSHANRASTAAKRKEDRTATRSAALGSAKVEHRSQVLLFMELVEELDHEGTEVDVEIPKVTFGKAGGKFRLRLDACRWRMAEIDKIAVAAEDEAKSFIENDKKVRLVAELVMKELKKNPAGLSGNELEGLIARRRGEIRAAVQFLYHENHVFPERRSGRGGGMLWKLSR